MPWKLARFKDCDGGCAVRAPRFPNDETDQAFSSDRYLTDEQGGTTPDGLPWTKGNALHSELWALYESKGRNARRIRLKDIDDLPLLSAIRALDWPKQSRWKGNALQFFLDTDFGWPARTPHVQAILDRFAELGLWDPTLWSSGLSYDAIYGDDEAEIVNGHRAIRGQTFHVEDEWDAAQRVAAEPACCHYWARV